MRRQKSHQQASSLVASERQDLPEEEREETTDAKTKSERIDELLPSMQREASSLSSLIPPSSWVTQTDRAPQPLSHRLSRKEKERRRKGRVRSILEKPAKHSCPQGFPSFQVADRQISALRGCPTARRGAPVTNERPADCER